MKLGGSDFFLKKGATNNVFPLAVTGHAATSSIGLDVDMICASIRAGIMRFDEHPYYHAMVEDIEVDEPEPVTAGFAPLLDEHWEGRERLHDMALQTLQALVENADLRRSELQECGLIVGLRQATQATEKWLLEHAFVPDLLSRTGLRGELRHTATIQDGGCSMLSGIEQAHRWISSGKTTSCIVLGVDTCMDAQLLRELDQAYRLKSDRGVDGFIPAEAASALLIEPMGSSRRLSRKTLAHLSPVGMGDEPRHQGTEFYSSGRGLQNAISNVLRCVPKDKPMQWIVCDLNGESYRAAEWGSILGRMPGELGAIQRLDHPKDCLGEVGAAIGGLLISYVIRCFERRCAPDDTALVWTVADDGKRSAIVVKSVVPEEMETVYAG